MGQIQSQLNQLFMAGIGAAMGVSRSPYMEGQRAIRGAGERISALQEVAATSSSPTATEAELKPEIAEAYKAYESAILKGGTAAQKKALYNTYEVGGDHPIQGGEDSNLPYLEYEHLYPGVGSLRKAFTETYEADYWGKDTLESIQKAYEQKRGIQDATQTRQLSLQEREKMKRKQFKKPEELL